MKNISIDPNIHFGKPCVTGTRITVQNVLELIHEDISFQDIVNNYYPDLRVEDIQACMRYAISLVTAEDINLTPALVPA